MFRCFRWPVLTATATSSGNDEIIIYHRNEYTITTACEHPEVAMRWADYFSTDDISVQSYWGPYGVALNKDEDGNITFLVLPKERTATSGTGKFAPATTVRSM